MSAPANPPFEDHKLPEEEFIELRILVPMPLKGRTTKVLREQIQTALADPSSALARALIQLGAISRPGWAGDAKVYNSYWVRWLVRQLRRIECEEN